MEPPKTKRLGSMTRPTISTTHRSLWPKRWPISVACGPPFLSPLLKPCLVQFAQGYQLVAICVGQETLDMVSATRARAHLCPGVLPHAQYLPKGEPDGSRVRNGTPDVGRSYPARLLAAGPAVVGHWTLSVI